MSPLGTLVAPTNNNNINNTNNSVKNSYYGINDPLLRLMSLSLASDPGSHQALAVLNSHLNLNNLSNLHCHSAVAAAAAAAAAAMQFKSAGNPLNTINVPVEPVSPLMVPSPSPSGLSMSSNGGHSESPPLTIPFAAIIANSAAVVAAAATTTTTITANSTHPPHHHNHNNESPGNDDDEVLSIGREDDEQMVIDCDSSTLSDDNIDKECHNDRMECLDMDEHQVTSPSASDSSNSRSRPRVRNYSSSEDCLQPDHDDPSHHNGSRETSRMLKRNQVGGDSGSTAPSRESLMFSIANILRPDFGLGPQPTLPLPHQLQQPVKHYHNHYNYSNHHYSIKLNQQSSLTSSSRKHHHAKGLPLSLTTLPSNHKMRRSDPVIPIDLSRPSSTDSSAISPIHRKKSSHSASSDPTENRHSNGVKNFKHSVHNGTSKSKPNPNIKTSNNNESNNERSNNNSSKKETTEDTKKKNSNNNDDKLWPAWVYCTRYSDRPSSGPRTRRGRKKEKEIDEKRPRTAFTADQLSRLKKEFDENRYLTEKRRQDLAKDLRLHENQIKIWFQNKRAKLKKANGQRGGLALQLMAQGLYNHSTIGPKNELDGDDSD